MEEHKRMRDNSTRGIWSVESPDECFTQRRQQGRFGGCVFCASETALRERAGRGLEEYEEKGAELTTARPYGGRSRNVTCRCFELGEGSSDSREIKKPIPCSG